MTTTYKTLLRMTLVCAFVVGIAALSACSNTAEDSTGNDESPITDDSSGFVLVNDVVPDVILEIRYYSTYNFVGERIDGYE